jgi:hydroxymethylglutaryl-CoA synthase
MRTPVAVGVEALGVHVPRFYLRLEDLAAARGVDPAKYLDGLGCRCQAVPAPGEDAAVYAYLAARKLLVNKSLDPSQIGLLIVGTESGVDEAKPIAAWLHRWLGLGCNCRIFDVKHACYSGTAALLMAGDWCRTHEHGKALVVATDVARYEIGSPGEPTQGAAAVAMLVGREPGCLQLEDFPPAVYSDEVMDFWRPRYRDCAVVDGKCSVGAYLKAVGETWRQYRRSSGLGWNDYDYFLFHVPFPKMAYKAFFAIHELDGNGSDPQELLARRVAPGLWASRDVGNCYSASLYLCLAALLEGGGEQVAGARVGLFSYGSGSCAEFFSARIGLNPEAWKGRTGLTEALAARERVDYVTYLDMRQRQQQLELNCDVYFPFRQQTESDGLPRFCGVYQHRRIYSLPAPAFADNLPYSASAQMGNVLR